MSQQALKQQIEQALGVTVKNQRSLHGGMIGAVYAVELADGERIVAKTSRNANSTTLATEGYMLRYLHEHSDIPLPDVLHSQPDLLLLSYIEGNSHFGKAEQQHAGELIAHLHNVSAPQHGMERDTIIAELPQPNPLTDSWIDFFREQRLLYMAKVAHDYGALPDGVFKRVQNFAQKLDDLLVEPDAPSLLHGDLWTTNILAHNGKITGFLDPAVYYGHAEIELAFSTLFGTFDRPFFERYTEIRPLEAGFFETRCDIYNLYPLLVHVRLFGGGYVRSVDSTLRKFGV